MHVRAFGHSKGMVLVHFILYSRRGCIWSFRFPIYLMFFLSATSISVLLPSRFGVVRWWGIEFSLFTYRELAFGYPLGFWSLSFYSLLLSIGLSLLYVRGTSWRNIFLGILFYYFIHNVVVVCAKKKEGISITMPEQRTGNGNAALCLAGSCFWFCFCLIQMLSFLSALHDLGETEYRAR